jgi:EmrB/QacA subfamily drug resistance transporter
MYAQQLARRQVFWTLAGVMLAMLLGALDQTIVGTAMPKIVADLGGFSMYTWATSIYMITSAVATPIAGKLSDTYGRRVFYIIGISIFVVASLACGLSHSMLQLIIFRGLQGVGGGIMMTNSFTVIADLFPPDKRGKYQGLLTATFSFASVIGPTTGGYLTDNVGWHWVFFINIPLGALAIFVFLKFFPKFQRDKLKHVMDYHGLTTLILMVVPTMLALSWGGVNYEWGSPIIIGMFCFSAVMLGMFLYFESRAEEPLVPLTLFKSRIVAVSNIVSFLMGMGMFGCIVFVPLFLQGVLGYSATASGNMQIPQSIAVMVSSIIAGQIISRRSGKYRVMGVLSMVLICTGIFLLSQLTPSSPFWMVIIDICIVGFGMGISVPVYTLAIQNNVPYEVLGTATSSANFIRSFGGSVGLAVLGAIMNNRFFPVLMNHIPDNIKNAISMEQLTALARNPNALVNAQAQTQLHEMLNQPGLDAGTYDRVIQILKESLNTAITQAFLVGFIMVTIGMIVSFWIKDKTPEEVRAAQTGMPPR